MERKGEGGRTVRDLDGPREGDEGEKRFEGHGSLGLRRG